MRDPSHYACLTPAMPRRMAKAAGLCLVEARTEPFVIDFEEWLGRGSAGAANRARIEAALAGRPGLPCFAVSGAAGEPRRLHLQLSRYLWRKPMTR